MFCPKKNKITERIAVISPKESCSFNWGLAFCLGHPNVTSSTILSVKKYLTMQHATNWIKYYSWTPEAESIMVEVHTKEAENGNKAKINVADPTNNTRIYYKVKKYHTTQSKPWVLLFSSRIPCRWTISQFLWSILLIWWDQQCITNIAKNTNGKSWHLSANAHSRVVMTLVSHTCPMINPWVLKLKCHS